MDIGELWQEHKRWLLGCAVGLLVYLIGGMVIESIYSTDAVEAQRARALRSFAPGETYTQAALSQAREEQGQLEVELARLRDALEFRQAPRFSLAEPGEPDDLHFSRVQLELRKELLGRANNLNVDLARGDLIWPAAVGEEIPSVLLGLALLDQAVNRLLDAHEEVVQRNPGALGLQVIESFKVDRAVGRGRPRVTRYRAARQEFDPEQNVRQETVTFSFRADTATTVRFLEACRNPDNPLALVELSLHQGMPGEPLQVRGTLAGNTFHNLD